MPIEAPPELDGSDYSQAEPDYINELDQSNGLHSNGLHSDVFHYVEYASDSLAISIDARTLERLMIEYLFNQCWVLSSQESWLAISQNRLLVDRDCVERTLAEKSAILDQQREQLAAKLSAAFEAEPVEDGMEHPAEQIIDEALQSGRNGPALNWLETFCLNTKRPSFAAATLRCLGRLTNPGPLSWRSALVDSALMLEDAELREAAVQAAESWGERDFAGVLQAHHETEPWLRDYIRDVIDDLGD